MTKEQAIEMYNSGWWTTKSPQEIVKFQMNEELLCMPFGEFHAAVEQVVGEPVYTHQFAYEPFREYVKKLVE